jgi:hypothetical protein
LACAFDFGFLDDSIGPDANNECSDAVATTGVASPSTACLNVLACDLGVNETTGASSAAPASGLLSDAFCGAGVLTSTCEAAATPAGVCESEWFAAFPTGSTATSIISNASAKAGSGASAGGYANALVANLKANCAVECFP